ncbi:MAG TPA: hypothetical protein VMT53_13750 [Terriglobales bacterium]|jgi:hypothetical protein|nr:hypothetical protein [Terriglobales bacterium]
MKVTLAIVLAVLTCSALSAAARTQSPQQSAPAADTSPPAASQTSRQQQEAPPHISQPCAESKDTCEVAPEQPSAAPVPKVEEKKAAKPSSNAAKHSSKKSHRHKSKKQETVAAPDPTAPKKIVVRQGGTSDPTAVLTPGATARGSYSPQMTADLLSTTDANLKQASSRPLTPAQEQTVSQIKLFMEQANAAVKAGDLDRGHNLAIKARLLSDDLVKH